MTDDDVRARLCRAMRYEGDDWLDKAEAQLDGVWRQQQKGRGQIHDVTTVGGRIRAARCALGLSQAQLAMRLQVDERVVSAWELGRKDLPVRYVRPLASALQKVTTQRWLLMETDEGAPDVPLDVLGRQHKKGMYEWRKRQRAWLEAKAEAERRNAARKERLGDGGAKP